MSPTPRILNVEERGWVGARTKPNAANMPTVADVLRDLLAGGVRRWPWESAVHDAGYDFREKMVLRDHTERLAAVLPQGRRTCS